MVKHVLRNQVGFKTGESILSGLEVVKEGLL